MTPTTPRKASSGHRLRADRQFLGVSPPQRNLLRARRVINPIMKPSLRRKWARLPLAAAALAIALTACGAAGDSGAEVATSNAATTAPTEPTVPPAPTAPPVAAETPTETAAEPAAEAAEAEPEATAEPGPDEPEAAPAPQEPAGPVVQQLSADVAIANAQANIGNLAPAQNEDNALDIEVLAVGDGSIQTLRNVVDGDRPVLLWFFSPH